MSAENEAAINSRVKISHLKASAATSANGANNGEEGGEKAAYICEECGKPFNSLYCMKDHMDWHRYGIIWH